MSIEDLYRMLEVGDDHGVNPRVSDSSTFAFEDAVTMERLISGTSTEPAHVYARHGTPSTARLGQLMAAVEGTEAGLATASGMSAIASTLLHFCSAGDEILCARTVYGGTFALMTNVLPRFGIRTQFIDMTDVTAVERSCGPNTRVLYCESLSNPLLEVAPLRALGTLARRRGIKLVVDNTFLPAIAYPATFGAHAVVHSATKFINGMADCIAGVVCGSAELIAGLVDIQRGTAMLLGGTLDSWRAAAVCKNLYTLHLRMAQHSRNALALATTLAEAGFSVRYPGLPADSGHLALRSLLGAGQAHPLFGGVLALEMESAFEANAFVQALSQYKLGHLAVSLGFHRTLFSVSSSTTASELSLEERAARGLSPGLVRISVGLDPDIQPLARAMLTSRKGALA